MLLRFMLLDMDTDAKVRASRNRTLILSENDRSTYLKRLLHLKGPVKAQTLENKTIHQDVLDVLDVLPHQFVDLLFIDPPYNFSKTFNNSSFKEMSNTDYQVWFESWFVKLLPVLKSTASVYICGDWVSSGAIQTVAEKYLRIQNRITWEREKGRGAKSNWKNCSEDIWFCTVSDHYYFNADAVKLKRKVIAPYTSDGKPKDWQKTELRDFRLTHPSNLWTDLTIPFWSMPENTDHPMQKPEKLLAKVLLASSREVDMIFDPFFSFGNHFGGCQEAGSALLWGRA
jgi:site-specific DNA-methyltransferase (adenine-specific)